MVGHEDGIVDGLFTFSRPVTGGYDWAPPIGGKLDLSILGI
jgi:putative iron-dependent peroxidase